MTWSEGSTMKWRKECHLKPQHSPCVSPPSSRFFSSSIAFILASWTSARAFHSPLFVFNPVNIGLISGWNRENSCKDTHGTCVEHKWTQTNKKEGMHVVMRTSLELLFSYLVHEGADEVDETALHLWQLICVISVHHRLKKSETVIIWWFCSKIHNKGNIFENTEVLQWAAAQELSSQGLPAPKIPQPPLEPPENMGTN